MKKNGRVETTVLAMVTDHEAGIEAVVAEITGGYSVQLRDTDAGEALEGVRVFPTEGAALAWARRLVTPRPARREIELTCRINGVAVSLEELAQELVRCGGIVAKTDKGSK